MSTSLETAPEGFLDWFRQNGGYLHPSLYLKKDQSGLSVYTNSALPELTRLISTPFGLAVTVETAKRALGALYPAAAATQGHAGPGAGDADGADGADGADAWENWSERMLVATYVALHWLHAYDTPPTIDVYQTEAKDTENPGKAETPIAKPIAKSTQSAAQVGAGKGGAEVVLRHQIYIAGLPSPNDLTTPLFFSKEERGLLRGTNLHGVVLDREGEMKEEWGRVRGVVGDLSWEQYLTATTYISSRAFPSRLLSIPAEGANETGPTANGQVRSSDTTHKDDGDATDLSYPVLIPGLDLFNHSRGQPITWLSSPITPIAPPTAAPSSQSSSNGRPTDPIPSVSFISTTPIPANSQVFNNYGPKSNEELLLSYGFVIPRNPDDTLILRLAAPTTSASAAETNAKRRFVIRRDGEVPRDLLELMRGLMGGGGPHIHGEGCNHDHDHDEGGVDDDDDDDEDEDGHAAHEKEMEEMQLEMDVLGELGGMLEDKLEKLRAGASEVETSVGDDGQGGGVREEVRRMVEIYRQGQIDIIEATQDKLSERIDRLEGLVDQGMGTCPCGC